MGSITTLCLAISLATISAPFSRSAYPSFYIYFFIFIHIYVSTCSFFIALYQQEIFKYAVELSEMEQAHAVRSARWVGGWVGGLG